MDPAVIDDRRRTVSLSHRKWRFWAEIGIMRGRAGMRWDAWGSWDGPERGRVRICCKGAPRRDRPREEARNINVSLPALRLDRGLCNRFGHRPGPASLGGRRSDVGLRAMPPSQRARPRAASEGASRAPRGPVMWCPRRTIMSRFDNNGRRRSGRRDESLVTDPGVNRAIPGRVTE